MNTIRSFACLAFGLAAVTTAHAQFSYVNSRIPDNDGNGLVTTLNVSGAAALIQAVTVTLNISSAPGDTAWNGDLYAYLTHDSGASTGFAVLLNRVGRTAVNDVGYGDPGFSITLSDAAANDVHAYQSISPSFDGDGRLTGAWQPDGRNILPTSAGSAFDSALRTANLSTFGGLDPNGLWVLFISDRAPGNEAFFDSWTLTITPVPEPQHYATVASATLLGFVVWRRRLQPRGSRNQQ